MTNEIDNTNKKLIDEDKKGNPNFYKGMPSNNPDGRPKGSVNEVTKFKAAIEAFEKEQNKDIYKFILEKASRYPQVLIAIFKALVPQQQQTEITTPESIEIIVKHIDKKIEE